MPKINRKPPLRTNKTYVKQCELSPVQKLWNPHPEHLVIELEADYNIIKYNDDGTATVEFKGQKQVLKNCSTTKYHEKWEFHKYMTWILRQEDWQQFLIAETGCMGYIPSLKEFFRKHMDEIHKHSKDFPMDWTILWCMFYHSEAYKLDWDWKNQKWMKQ